MSEPTKREPHGYVVSVKGMPNIAKAFWADVASPAAETAALEAASKEWGIPVARLYIYRGQDE